MRFLRSLVALFFAFVCVLAGFMPAYSVPVSVDGVRFGISKEATRFVLDLSGPAKPRVFLLGNPARVVIDIPEASWKATQAVKPLGVVARYRHGIFSPGVYRIVLDLKSPAVIGKEFILPSGNGYSDRFVLDLKNANASNFADAVSKSRKNRLATRPAATVAAVPRPVKSGKRIIVVDPGHGGVDPGTLGRSGENEKTLTLKISREIKKQLEATGRYQVYLTRNSDIYLAHRQRFGLAKRVNADLFLSIHVDAIADKRVRGGTVYTLNENASDKEAARLARKENKSDIIAGVDLAETNNEVASILIDLAQRETMNESAEYAEILLGEMRQQVKMHKRGHRFANFLVLKSPDVPSVLVETGYITNRADAKLLSSRDGQIRIAKAVREATDAYFEKLASEGR